jgi:hypothetical protein
MSKRLWTALVLVPLTGCFTYEDAVRTRAANDFNCSEDKVAVDEVGGKGFRANGCGKVATYVCVGSESNPTCMRE